MAQDRVSRGISRRSTTYLPSTRPKERGRAFVPAGQSTQMIIGATPETDFQILNLSQALYKTLQLKRVFFSAYLPVSSDERLPQNVGVQLNRERTGCIRPIGCCAITNSMYRKSSAPVPRTWRWMWIRKLHGR